MSNELRTTRQDMIPEYMRGDRTGAENAREYFVPPTLKIVQNMSADALKERFNVGDVVVMPFMNIIAPVRLNEAKKPTDVGEPFFFVPLLFFAEYVCWNPIATRGSEPAVRGRTYEKNSEIARCALNENLRVQPHPDRADLKISFCEHLNFLVTLIDHELEGAPILMSFSRAEHFRGKTFRTLQCMNQVPIYGRVYRGQSAKRVNQKGNWFGIDATNPNVEQDEPSPWVDESLYRQCEKWHHEYSAMLQDNALKPDYQETTDETEEELTDAPGKF